MKGVGVVLCPSAPQELNRAQAAFRRLAEQLQRAGFDVLRFDYRGTGDSNGELADTTPALWIEDIGRAVRELKDISGVRKLFAVGFRVGALLLAQARSQGLAVDQVVLWEPVVSGAHWLAQIAQLDERVAREFMRQPAFDEDALLGFVVPPSLRRQWAALDLSLVPRWPGKTSVVFSADSTHFDLLKRAWATAGQEADWCLASSETDEAKMGALLGNQALDQIVQLLGQPR